MIIHLDELSDKIQAFTFDEKPENIPALDEINATGQCSFNHMVDIELGARQMGDLIIIEGRFKTLVGLTCNRCLKQYQTTLEAPFNLNLTSELPEKNAPVDTDEIELRSEEIGLLFFQGEIIDLRNALQSEIVMAVPMKPLCKPECEGLCAKCGADLNLNNCSCEEKNVDPRFAVLKNLKIKE